MKTRAKFYCSGVEKSYNGYQKRFTYTARFHAVTGDSEENKSFWQYTPSGSVELCTIREDLFEPGKEYYLDFTPAEPAG